MNVRNEIEDAYPLTPTQSGMLFHTLSEPESEHYFEQLRCDLHGDLDIEQLRAAWQIVVDRHPVLRTMLVWQGVERPLQVVRRRVDVPFDVLDWRDDATPARRHRLDELCSESRRRSFELTAAPLMRLTIVQLTDDLAHLVWDFHHIILDGWSTSLVFEEAHDVYECLVAGDEPASASAPPFKSFIGWLQRQDADAAEAYWRGRVGDIAEPTRLAGAAPDTSFDLARSRLVLPAEVTERLRACARAQRVTVNTILQSAWAVLLHRYLGADDVVFGVTSAGRPAELAHVEQAVGMFLTTLPMRLGIGGHDSIADLLREAQTRQLEMDEYQHGSLADIQRWSQVAGGQALFDTLLIFENFPASSPRDGRTLTVADKSVFEQTNYPLTLLVGATDEIEMLLLHDRSRTDESDAQRLLDHLAAILRSIADDPMLPVAGIEMIGAAERDDLLNDGSGPAVDAGSTSTVQLFLEQASRSPDHVALRAGEVSMTYGELADAVRRLAAEMSAAGAAPGGLIGICLPRSAEMVVALLATQLVGGGYVPLDPQFPDDRVRYMIDDADLTLLVTTAELAARFAPPGLAVLDVGAPAGPGADHVVGAPAGDDTAYVIYTSGSTGLPKGVEIPHRALTNFLVSMADRPGLAPDDVLAAVTTLSFDIAALELFVPLITGATLIVVPDEVRADGAALARLIEREGVTVMQATPATWRLLIESGWEGSPELRILCGGEALTPALAADLLTRGRDIWNMYGPTETTIWSTVDRVDDPAAITIGRPIANTTTSIRDSHGRLLPRGVVGELCIGGLGLATGYRNRPELTAEKFVDADDGTGRFYRTGDLARVLPDGRIECLGRNDHQLKVRGFRIEPGEIESLLVAVDGVTDAVAAVRPIGPSESLVAYYVADRDVAADELRHHLRRSVPDYMVPSMFVPLDALPLTPNGKLDRNALPAPNAPRRDAAAMAPSTETERVMIDLWQTILETEPIGADDDFFELGGHSLLAVRLFSQLTSRFDVNIPLSRLIDAPTVRGISTVVDAARRQDEDEQRPWHHLVPFGDPEPATLTLFCVHGAGGNVLNFHDLARHLAPAWQLVGIEAAGIDGVTPPHTTMDEICDAYLPQMLGHQPDGPYFVAGFSSGGSIAYELGVRLAASGHDVGAVVLLDTFHPRTELGRRNIGHHLRMLRTYGFSYVTNRIAERRVRRTYGLAPDMIAEETRTGDTVPIESRDAHLVANTRGVIEAYEPPRFDGPVWLFTAGDVNETLAHVGPDRGWDQHATSLDVEVVPGDHTDFVLEPHARSLATALRRKLDCAVDDSALG